MEKMKIVLIDGSGSYSVAGHPTTIKLGLPVELEKSLADSLLAQRCGQGRPMFVNASDFDLRPVRLKLTDRDMNVCIGSIYAQGFAPTEVPNALVPYLLGLKRDGAPVFERA
jgi:hypothetical protein